MEGEIGPSSERRSWCAATKVCVESQNLENKTWRLERGEKRHGFPFFIHESSGESAVGSSLGRIAKSTLDVEMMDSTKNDV